MNPTARTSVSAASAREGRPRPGSPAHDIEGEGRLLVALHGLTEDRSFFDRVPLADRFRVVRVDLRGHGSSPGVPPYDPLTLAADVHGLVRTLAPGARPPLVVGHSYGGVVATAYASRYPARGVVTIDQALDVAPLPPSIAEAVRGADFETFMTGFFAQAYGELDPAIVEDLEGRRRLRRDVVLGAWAPLLDLDEPQLTSWMADLLALPRACPYLSLHGTPPGAGYPAWLAGRIPGALVETAPVKTHYPHLAAPAWFLRRLADFDAAIPEPPEQ